MTYAQMLMYDEAISQLNKLLNSNNDAPAPRRRPKRLTGEARRVLFEKASH